MLGTAACPSTLEKKITPLRNVSLRRTPGTLALAPDIVPASACSVLAHLCPYPPLPQPPLSHSHSQLPRRKAPSASRTCSKPRRAPPARPNSKHPEEKHDMNPAFSRAPGTGICSTPATTTTAAYPNPR
ncbi:hypothetical protein H0H92_011228 [Tricholoma furcatifolium]|nr:hypothetical protein H0H92_011228 [Tricholoma furcatifolium]